MNKKISAALLAGALLTAASGHAATQIDAKTTNLSTRFSPDQAMDVALGILGVGNREKGAYEKESEYQARIKGMLAVPIMKDRALGDQFVFRALPDWTQFKYNADKEEWTYSVRINGYEPANGIPVDRRAAKTGEYSITDQVYAQNYGKVVEHTKTIFLQIPTLKSASAVSGTFKAKPEVARRMEGWMAVYVIGRLRPPFFQNYDGYAGRGENVVDHQWRLPFAVEEIIAVNRNTGEILARKYTLSK